MSAPIDLDGDHPMLLSKPKTRGECEGGFRPCPWVSCRYHLAISIAKNNIGSAVRVLSDPDDWTADTATCALDVAEEGEHGVRELGRITGLSFQGVSASLTEARAKVLRHFPQPSEVLDMDDRQRPDLHWEDPVGLRTGASKPPGGSRASATHTARGRLRQEPALDAHTVAHLIRITPRLKAAAAATARTLPVEEHAAALDLLQQQLTRRGRPCS